MKKLIALLYLLFIISELLMAEIVPPQEILPLESYGYDECFHKISQKTNQPVGVLVVAFNRPDCLVQLLASLENNPESETLPFYFFLDGGVRATQDTHTALINASGIKDKTVIARNKNYGCPKNHIDAKRFMFDWCGYEKVIIIEEDLKISASFLSMNLKLNAWMYKTFKDLPGVAQCWSYCYLPVEEKIKQLNRVFSDTKRWWSFVGYCLNREVWEKMSSFLYVYERFIDLIPEGEEYDKGRSKPGLSPLGLSIQNWARKYINNEFLAISKMHTKNNNQKISAAIKKFVFSEGFRPSQDCMTAIALWLAGGIKITTVVNRARHVGVEGITTDQAKFEERYENIVLDEFTEKDSLIYQFMWTN